MTEAPVSRPSNTLEREWQEKYQPFSQPCLLPVFPPQVIGDSRTREQGIPMINGRFVGRAMRAEGQRIGDLVVVAVTETDAGRFVYPMENVAGDSRQIISMVDPRHFERQFDVVPSAEEIEMIRTYLHVNARITGGADLLFAARFLMARDIWRMKPSRPGVFEEIFGMPFSWGECQGSLGEILPGRWSFWWTKSVGW
jgi:hypothetical protein